ncbi:hypothetical protein DI09_5p10, partial [Mitosporidium daphniae]
MHSYGSADLSTSPKPSNGVTINLGKSKFGKSGKAPKESIAASSMLKKKSNGNNNSSGGSTAFSSTLANELSNIEQWDCPLCMEQVDMGDVNFVPCECGYQICRFCWHHIKFVLNDLCPACRRSYSKQEDSPLVSLKPLSTTQGNACLKKKKPAATTLSSDQIIPLDNNGTRGGAPLGNVLASRKHLIDVRVLQSNLVYVVGIPLSLSLYRFEKTFSSRSTSIFNPVFISALEELLASKKYFGKFGNILKLVINIKGHHSGSSSSKRSTSTAAATFPTVSAFLTFEKPEDASVAIGNIDNSLLEGCLVRATYGTTKYCAFFLRGQTCPNQSNCLYLHELGQSQNSYTKESLSHRQRDISLKRLFGVSSQAQSEISNANLGSFDQNASPSGSPENDPKDAPLNQSQATSIKCAQTDADSAEIALPISPSKAPNEDLQSVSSMHPARSSSRFTFVADLNTEHTSSDLPFSEPNFPMSDLFESFKSPTPFGCLTEAKSPHDFEEQTPKFCCSLEDINNSCIEFLDKLNFGLDTLTDFEDPTATKSVQPTYLAAAKSSPLNVSNTPNPDHMPKKPVECKNSAFTSKSSVKKTSDPLQKPAKPKNIQSQTSIVSSMVKKDNDHRTASKENDFKPSKSATFSSISQENTIPKPSNPFMFLTEEDFIHSVDGCDNFSAFSSAKQQYFSANNGYKSPGLQKNSKKKKKHELKHDIDDQIKNHLEFCGESTFPQINLDDANFYKTDTLKHHADVDGGENFDLHKTFSTVLSFLESYITSESERLIDPLKYHHIDKDDGDIFSLNSVYNSLELNDFTSVTGRISSDIQCFLESPNLVDMTDISSDLAEFDRLVGINGDDFVDGPILKYGELFHANCDVSDFHLPDSYVDLESYRYSLPQLEL